MLARVLSPVARCCYTGLGRRELELDLGGRGATGDVASGGEVGSLQADRRFLEQRRKNTQFVERKLGERAAAVLGGAHDVADDFVRLAKRQTPPHEGGREGGSRGQRSP